MSLNIKLTTAITMQVLDRIASEHGIMPKQVKLELTEGVLMNDHARTRGRISDLKQRQIKISIDDFGTGYSSLGYLHQFDVDELKIDRSFVAEMLTDPRSMAISRAIIVLGRGLGLNTVAEGIEKREQATLLRAAGCDYGKDTTLPDCFPKQRFWLGCKPVHPSDLIPDKQPFRPKSDRP